MYAALRLWTSDTRLRTTHGEMAFYELLNRTLREDSEPMMAHAAVITRALAMFCCKHGSSKHAESRDRRAPSATSVFRFYSPTSSSPTWPFKYWPDGTNSTAANTTYRGGGLPAEHFTFYRDLAQAGAKFGGAFRCPSFVASSFQRPKAVEFMHGSADGVHHCVLYTLVFDAQDGCQHANLIKKSHGTQFEDEDEFLLPPYSVFRVQQVGRGTGSAKCPHRVTLRVEPCNQSWPLDLPSTAYL